MSKLALSAPVVVTIGMLAACGGTHTQNPPTPDAHEHENPPAPEDGGEAQPHANPPGHPEGEHKNPPAPEAEKPESEETSNPPAPEQ